MEIEWLFTQSFIGDIPIAGRFCKWVFLLVLPVLGILNLFLTLKIHCCELFFLPCICITIFLVHFGSITELQRSLYFTLIRLTL